MAKAKQTSAKTATYRTSTHGKITRESYVSYNAMSVSAYGLVKSRNRPGTVIISKLNRADWAPLPPPRTVQPPINQAAIALLRSWRNEDPEQQRQDWEKLKQAIDEDRPPDRKLFS